MGDDKISGQAVRKGTGHDWDHWFAMIDSFGELPDHTARTARLAEAAPDLGGWWVQSIVVQYERKRKLRVVGQTSKGDFQVTCSKTLYADVDEVWKRLTQMPFVGTTQWVEGAEHKADGVGLLVRRVVPQKLLRWFWFDDDGKSTVEVDLQAKDDRTVVRFTHHGLSSKAAGNAYRARWKEVLEALQDAD